jgi:hypothetical protein
MRGYTSEQRIERKEAVKRAELDRTSHMIVLAARQALVTAIERYAMPGHDPRALRMVAITGLFADVVAGMAGTAAAPHLIEVINRQLEQAGLRLVPVAAN